MQVLVVAVEGAQATRLGRDAAARFRARGSASSESSRARCWLLKRSFSVHPPVTAPSTSNALTNRDELQRVMQCFTSTLEKHIKVLIAGSHADVLIPQTSRNIYSRRKGRKSLQFEFLHHDEDDGKLVDVAIVIVDAACDVDSSETSADLRSLSTVNSRASYIVFMDPPPFIGDASRDYLLYLVRRARASAYYNLDCLPSDITSSGGMGCLLDVLFDIICPTECSMWADIVTHARDEALDFFARCLSLPCSQTLPDVENELSFVNADTSDDHIWALAQSSLSQDWENTLRASLPEDVRDVHPFPAHRIAPSLIAKYPTVSEQESMEFVRQHTTIPLPRTHPNDLGWLIMDRVEGETLLSCWRRLSWLKQLRVACTLRLYVKQLRALGRSYPGNVVDGCVSGLFFTSSLVEKEFGPYSSADAMRRFCTYAAYTTWDRSSHFADNTYTPPPDPDFDWSPVFVHGDLNMTNILLDREGTVWLIDWGWAGYYPACLESLAMRHSNLIALSDVVPASWNRYRAFIAGPIDGGMERFWYYVRDAVYHV